MMNEEIIFIISLLKDFGFEVVVGAILIYDRFKSSRALKKIVENNSRVLTRLELRLKKIDGGFKYGRRRK